MKRSLGFLYFIKLFLTYPLKLRKKTFGKHKNEG